MANKLNLSVCICVKLVLSLTCVIICFQTVTGAMSLVNPPVRLGDPSHQFRIDYIQDVASQPNFDYPPVTCLCFCTM